MRKKWFEGSNTINCSIQNLGREVKNHGKFYEGVVSHMPGISYVELLEQGKDYLIIKTNEGLMKRTNIKKSIESKFIMVEFDEEYIAGKMVTTRSHYHDEFSANEDGIEHRITISDVKAPGVLGKVYRIFGSSNIGKAVLTSHKIYLEALKD